MIIDKIENLRLYANLNPYFPQIIEFLKNTDLNSLENGKHEIDGKNCFVNIMDTKGKTKEEATMETHVNMLDIQHYKICILHQLIKLFIVCGISRTIRNPGSVETGMNFLSVCLFEKFQKKINLKERFSPSYSKTAL